MDVSYDPGILRLDARLTLQGSIGSILHELTYEHKLTDSTYSTTHTLAKECSPESVDDENMTLTDSLSRDDVFVTGEREGESVDQLRTIMTGEDSNSSLLSPASNIDVEFSVNDSNSSEGSGTNQIVADTTATFIQHTAGYVPDTLTTLQSTNTHSNRPELGMSEFVGPAEHMQTGSDAGHPKTGSNRCSEQEMRVRSGLSKSTSVRSCGYVYTDNGNDSVGCMVETISTPTHHAHPPHVSSSEDPLPPTGNRNPDSVYTSDSIAHTPLPGHPVAIATTSVREATSEQQQRHQERQQEQRRRQERQQEQQRRCQGRQQEQQQQQRQEIQQEKQQQQEQQQHERHHEISQGTEGNSLQKTCSSLSLDIITDIEEAFPLSSHLASSDDSLHHGFLPDLPPQLMPTHITPSDENEMVSAEDQCCGEWSTGYVAADACQASFVVNDKESRLGLVSDTSHSTSDVHALLPEKYASPHHVSLTCSPSHSHSHSHTTMFKPTTPTHSQTKALLDNPTHSDAHTRTESHNCACGLSDDYVNLENDIISLSVLTEKLGARTATELRPATRPATSEMELSSCHDSTDEDFCGLLPGYNEEERELVDKETAENRGFHNILFELSPDDNDDNVGVFLTSPSNC